MTAPELTLERPVLSLDPTAQDVHAEAARIRAAGPVVPVDVLGVSAWAVSDNDIAQRILESPDFAMNSRNWGALQRGEVPAGWPLLKIILGQNMGTSDGADHRRLRGPLIKAFTARRVQSMAPGIKAITQSLLDEIGRRAEQNPRTPLDLKELFATPLPIGVICALFGVDRQHEADLHRLCDNLFDTTSGPETVAATEAGLHAFMSRLLDAKTAEPGDDLTSALLAQNAAESGARANREELIDTLILVLAAGHQTTINFFTNTLLSLMTHPGTLAAVRAGQHSWSKSPRSRCDGTRRWRKAHSGTRPAMSRSVAC